MKYAECSKWPTLQQKHAMWPNFLLFGYIEVLIAYSTKKTPWSKTRSTGQPLATRCNLDCWWELYNQFLCLNDRGLATLAVHQLAWRIHHNLSPLGCLFPRWFSEDFWTINGILQLGIETMKQVEKLKHWIKTKPEKQMQFAPTKNMNSLVKAHLVRIIPSNTNIP